jgi:hypothetical protein
MIQRRSKFIILVTVLAVIIVAFPITFYEYNSKPVPIETTNSITHYVWKEPFLNYSECRSNSNPPGWTDNFSSATYISTPSCPNSTLSITMEGYAEYYPICWHVAVDGVFAHKIHPISLVVYAHCEAVSSFQSCHNGIVPNLTNLSCPYDKPIRTMDNISCWTSASFSLLNYSRSANSSFYHIGAKLRECPSPGYPSNYVLKYPYVIFIVELYGLSKPVFAQIVVKLEET